MRSMQPRFRTRVIDFPGPEEGIKRDVGFRCQREPSEREEREGQPVVGPAVVAGNRNIALFLLALPSGVTDQILLFVGCWQFPMYLTPLLLRRIYRPKL